MLEGVYTCAFKYGLFTIKAGVTITKTDEGISLLITYKSHQGCVQATLVDERTFRGEGHFNTPLGALDAEYAGRVKGDTILIRVRSDRGDFTIHGTRRDT